MPREKKTKVIKTAGDTQTEIYLALEKAGWAPGSRDCLHAIHTDRSGATPKVTRVRLNFQHPEMLRLEHRVVRTREEMKAMNTHVRAVWEVVNEAAYGKVVVQDNQPVFVTAPKE